MANIPPCGDTSQFCGASPYTLTPYSIPLPTTNSIKAYRSRAKRSHFAGMLSPSKWQLVENRTNNCISVDCEKPKRPKISKEVQITSLYRMQGHFAQPIIRKLAIVYDRIDWWVNLLPEKEKGKVSVATTADGFDDAKQPIGQQLYNLRPGRSFAAGQFHFRPSSYCPGICQRMYFVRHSSFSDPILRIRMHPKKGRPGRAYIHVEDFVVYAIGGLALVADFVDALNPYAQGLSMIEVKGLSNELHLISTWIKKAKAVKKNAQSSSVKIGKAKRNSKGDIVIDETQPPLEMKVGSGTSSRRFTIYHCGPGLVRRNKAFIGNTAMAAGIECPNGNFKNLFAIEARLKGKEANRLSWTNEAGELVELKTIRDLTGPNVAKGIFRKQIETGFNFRMQGKRGKTIPFFDWDAIGATDLVQRTTRKSNGAYSAKQAVKRLLLDGRKGDYLRQGIEVDTLPLIAEHISDSGQELALEIINNGKINELLKINGGQQLQDLYAATITQITQNGLKDWISDTSTNLTEDIASMMPDLIARRIAAEFEVANFYSKTTGKAACLPEVDRDPVTLKSLESWR